jgi:nucleoside-diphosphate-sugar epimerase
MTTAFVTGATGLLGNNLVRLLVEKGVTVKALVRSKTKAMRQLAGLPFEVIEGEMTDVGGFEHELADVDTIFHTAAEFRDSFKGGRHWDKLHAVNVLGTEKLLGAAYARGVRRVVHTSSTGTIDGPVGIVKDETMRRREEDAFDDYYRSKIQSDEIVLRFLQTHPDFFAVLVLPGWMHGPGDAGPTSAGQIVLDFVKRKLPGVVPGTFSLVDARDVAWAELLAAEKGRRGERYLAAGRYITMRELFGALEHVTGVKAPERPYSIPFAVRAGLYQRGHGSANGQAPVDQPGNRPVDEGRQRKDHL